MGTTSEWQSIHHTAFLDNNELNFPPRLFHSNKEMWQRIPGGTLKVLLIPTEYAQIRIFLLFPMVVPSKLRK